MWRADSGQIRNGGQSGYVVEVGPAECGGSGIRSTSAWGGRLCLSAGTSLRNDPGGFGNPYPSGCVTGSESGTLAEWLQSHPGVEIISRDRAGAYAEGAREGATGAIQVADRFHLLKNVRDLVERVVDRHREQLRQVAEQLADSKAKESRGESRMENPNVQADSPEVDVTLVVVVESDPQTSLRSQGSVGEVNPTQVETSGSESAASMTQKQHLQHQRRTQRHQRYQQVVELARQGASQQAIAHHLNLSRKTVRRFVRAESFPERATPAARPTALDSFLEYLKTRWAAGCYSAAQLWREIVARGFQGCQGSVRQLVVQWRQALPLHLQRTRGRQPATTIPPRKIPSPRCVTWWLLGLAKEKTETDRADHQVFVDRLCLHCPEIQSLRTLASEFFQIVRHRLSDALSPWVEAAADSSIPEIKSFASGLRRDWDAVWAALKLDWSNGQVEGQVTRVKFIKRQMFGRAKFDLLRARVLYSS